LFTKPEEELDRVGALNVDHHRVRALYKTRKPEIIAGLSDMEEGYKSITQGVQQMRESMQFMADFAGQQGHQTLQAWWRVRELQDENRMLKTMNQQLTEDNQRLKHKTEQDKLTITSYTRMVSVLQDRLSAVNMQPLTPFPGMPESPREDDPEDVPLTTSVGLTPRGSVNLAPRAQSEGPVKLTPRGSVNLTPADPTYIAPHLRLTPRDYGKTDDVLSRLQSRVRSESPQQCETRARSASSERTRSSHGLRKKKGSQKWKIPLSNLTFSVGAPIKVESPRTAEARDLEAIRDDLRDIPKWQMQKISREARAAASASSSSSTVALRRCDTEMIG
jgi:hypothetical protein